MTFLILMTSFILTFDLSSSKDRYILIHSKLDTVLNLEEEIWNKNFEIVYDDLYIFCTNLNEIQIIYIDDNLIIESQTLEGLNLKVTLSIGEKYITDIPRVVCSLQEKIMLYIAVTIPQDYFYLFVSRNGKTLVPVGIVVNYFGKEHTFNMIGKGQFSTSVTRQKLSSLRYYQLCASLFYYTSQTVGGVTEYTLDVLFVQDREKTTITNNQSSEISKVECWSYVIISESQKYVALIYRIHPPLERTRPIVNVVPLKKGSILLINYEDNVDQYYYKTNEPLQLA